MRKIKFITDSTCDLSPMLIEEYSIDVLPLHVLLGENDCLDNGQITSKDLFDYADSTGTLPKSAAVNEFEAQSAFSKWLDEDYDIFFMGISSELSATMQSAKTAASKLDPSRISIVDSLSLSTGTALILLEAADKAISGASLKEISEYALSLQSKVHASFIVDTLKYLYMGGRCSKLSSIMGTSLKIKPILELKDGKIVPGEKLRGKNYIKKYYDHIMTNKDKIDPKRVFVTHCMTPEAPEVKKQLEEEFGFKKVYVTDASATISTHCGPGTLGILYLNK